MLVAVQLATIVTELSYLDLKFNMEDTLQRMIVIQCADNNVNIANQ